MWIWFAFIGIVLLLLMLDLGFFHKTDRIISFKESLWMSAFYILIGILFGAWIGYLRGIDQFAEYLTSFLVEKSLSIDNVFLISMIFSSLSIPLKYQHRVLFWGILGAIVFRGIMIALGVEILHQFEWVLYVFALMMIATGVKILFSPDRPVNIAENQLMIWLKNRLNITEHLDGKNFYIYQKDPVSGKSKLFFTPLFVALVSIECMDLIFAVDSIPAVFSITQDPLIIYTSNIFAILGLRALYFALASIIHRFHYLRYSLALILIFIGSKMFIADALNLSKIPPLISLGVTLSLLSGGVILSLCDRKP